MRSDLYEARLALLYRISHAVVESRSLSEIVDVALNGLQELIPFWRGSVVIFHVEDDEAAVYAATGEGERALGAPGQRIALSYYGGDLELLSRGEIDLLQAADGSEGFRSRALVPMLGEGGAFGSLNMAATEPNFFTEARLTMAREVANQVAVAVRQTVLVERALAATQAKSTFLANMSHELRTPLNAIIGYTELIAENDLSPQVAEDLDRVSLAARGLVELISDVLDLSSVEAGRALPRFAEVPLGPLLEEIEAVAHPVAHTEGNTLIIAVQDAPECLYTDRMKLRQILLNLVVNACKFTQNGSVRLSIASREASVVFTVADTGIGIAPEALPDLFEAFTRAHSGTPGVYRGTGLGLALAAEFVRLMGGSIDVRSVLNEGTTFEVVLPIRDRPARAVGSRPNRSGWAASIEVSAEALTES